MKDIPIIFSGPMVRALLGGRKTMTRRLLKPAPEICFSGDEQLPVGMLHVEGEPRPRLTIGRVVKKQQIRFAPGDRLWVRENFSIHEGGAIYDGAGGQMDYVETEINYAADYLGGASFKWKPSIHMPRTLSRITLLVTGVKVERLQAIPLRDVEAEGCEVRQFWLFGADASGRQQIGANVFRGLWEKINGVESWAANPYVVALTFTVQKQNIDALPKADAA